MAQRYASDLRERVFRFACDIVTFSRELSAEPGVVRNIAWQLADAATSVAANYEGAKAAYSRREFAVKKLHIAQGSARITIVACHRHRVSPVKKRPRSRQAPSGGRRTGRDLHDDRSKGPGDPGCLTLAF